MLQIRSRAQARWGTLQAPELLAVDLSRANPQPNRLAFRLGHTTAPATAVWAFVAPRPVEVQVQRRGQDPLLSHVAVALQSADGRRIGSLITQADGGGPPLQVPAGSWRVVATIGIPEEVSVELELTVRPRRAYARGLAAAATGATAAMRRPQAQALATGDVEGLASRAEPMAIGLATGDVAGLARATDVRLLPSLARGVSTTTGVATARKAPFRWIDSQGRPAVGGAVAEPVQLEATVERFSDWFLELRFRDRTTGVPLPLAGHTVVMELWDDRHYVFYGAATIEDLDVPTGHVRGRFGPSITGSLPIDGTVVRAEVAVIGPSGELAYPAAWLLTVSEGVTR